MFLQTTRGRSLSDGKTLMESVPNSKDRIALEDLALQSLGSSMSCLYTVRDKGILQRTYQISDHSSTDTSAGFCTLSQRVLLQYQSEDTGVLKSSKSQVGWLENRLCLREYCFSTSQRIQGF